MQRTVKIYVYHARQCDPKKCTSLRLKRRGLIRLVPRINLLPRRSVVLNPFSEIAFSPADTERMREHGLAALDCSWEHAVKVLKKHVRGTSRCLPILIAGNPVNFGQPSKLTTVEALAAALIIGGSAEEAEHLLSTFKWGHTFLELNIKELVMYAGAKDSAEVIRLQAHIVGSRISQKR